MHNYVKQNITYRSYCPNIYTVPPCMHILYAYKILPGYFQNIQVSSWGQRLLDLFEFEKKVLETNVHLHSLSQ